MIEGSPLIDAARVRNLRDEYPDIVDRLVALFAESAPPLLEQLGQALDERDDSGLRRVAHKLKGSCQNVGATRMAALCLEVERADGRPAALVDELHTTYPATLAEIRAVVAG